MASHLDKINFRISTEVDEVAAASRMARLGFRPDCHEFRLAVQENSSDHELYSVAVLTD